jgi:hypothetical protein
MDIGNYINSLGGKEYDFSGDSAKAQDGRVSVGAAARRLVFLIWSNRMDHIKHGEFY